MDDYLNELQNKYGYNPEIIETLKKIIPAFVEHYGKENQQVIFDAISNCEIHLQEENENTENYLSNFFPNKTIGKIPTIVTAFYDSMPIATEDGISAKRLIYLTSKGANDLQSENTLSTLVHEIGHLIKSYNNEFSIVDGKIQQRSGLSITNIEKKDGKYIGVEDTNNGIEEAINCYDEEKVMSIILGKKFNTNQYFHNLNGCIDQLFENQDLIYIFRQAQINGTNEHIKYLGENEFKNLSELFENLHYIVTSPTMAKKKSNGLSISELLNNAKSNIIEYAKEYSEKKHKNFSLAEIETLDQTITFNERDNGIKSLKTHLQEAQKEIINGGEKENDSRI